MKTGVPLVRRMSATGRAIVCALIVGTVAAGTAAAVGWVGASAIEKVSGGIPVIEPTTARRDVALTTKGADVAVLWSGSESVPGIYAAYGTSAGWDPGVRLSDPQLAWAPTVAYIGDQMVGSWLEGAGPNDYNVARTIIAHDDGVGQQTVLAGLYGDASPNLHVGSEGLHLAFGAAAGAEFALEADLYYAYRPFGQTDWPTPEVIVSHALAVPAADSGGILRPRAVEDATAEKLYVVWEQYARTVTVMTDTSVISHTAAVWYVAGDLSEGAENVTWGAPIRLSPTEQEYAVLPTAALTGDGNLHVAWTQLLGPGTSRTDEQHVWYRSLTSGEPVPLNGVALHVNETFPSWVASSIATRGNGVCVVWHGYSGMKGGDYEDVAFRCSRDAGQSWDQIVTAMTASDRGGIFPATEIDVTGRLHIAWIEYTVGTPEGRLSATSSVQALGAYYRAGYRPHAIFMPLIMRGR